MDRLLDTLAPVFDAYATASTVWMVALSVFVIGVLAFRIRSTIRKLESPDNWSSSDRRQGLEFAIENKVPTSRVTVSLASIFSIGGVIGLLGAYQTFAYGSLGGQLVEGLTYLLWALAGLMGVVLAAYRMRLKNKLLEYHKEWIGERYLGFISEAREFFIRYVLDRAALDEKIENPFVYLSADYHDDTWREHLGEEFHDRIYIDGVFPGEKKSLVTVPPEGRFEFDLVATTKNHYAAEHASMESDGDGDLGYLAERAENVDLDKHLAGLDYQTTGLNGTYREETLSDINPTGFKWLLGYFREKGVREVFYTDVSGIRERHGETVIQVPRGEPIRIKASERFQELTDQMTRQIKKVIRSKK